MDNSKVTAAYIDGIKDGREFLTANPDLTLDEMIRCKENVAILMRTHSGEMKQGFKGERDFWNLQIKEARNL